MLLHELGHLQVVHPTAKRWDRRYAGETKADEFAATMRGKIWSQPIDHEDPIHNAPSDAEMAFLPAWERMDKCERYDLVRLVVQAPHPMLPHLAWMRRLDPVQMQFVTGALAPRSAV